MADNVKKKRHRRLKSPKAYEFNKEEFRQHKVAFIAYFTLRALVILTLFLQLRNGNYENVFTCLLTLILLLLPRFVEKEMRIDIPDTLEVILMVFVFAAEILGEIEAFYVTVENWDTILHTVNGFIAAAVGFSLVNLLNKDEESGFRLSPIYLALTAFCFSMTIGVLWEFFEFSMDHFFGMDMQKDTVIHVINSVSLDPTMSNKVVSIDDITSVVLNGQDLGLGGYLDIGLIDTMEDLFVNFIGATIYSIFGYIYVKTKGRKGIAGRFMLRKIKDENPAQSGNTEPEAEKITTEEKNVQ